MRPIKVGRGINGKPADFVIVREGTECLYIKREWVDDINGNKVGWAIRKISSRQSKRVAKYALDLALSREKQRQAEKKESHVKGPLVTIVHKSNVLTVTDGIFRKSVKDVAESDPKYAGIRIEEQIVDSML